MLPGHAATAGTDAPAVLGQLFGWLDGGLKGALAVVVETWGSSPRPAGSLLAVNAEKAFVGSVSGGCVEGAVVSEALQLMKTGGFKSLEFGVADEDAWKVGLACGGRVRVFVAAVDAAWRLALDGLAAAAREKRPAALVVDLEKGAPGLIVEGAAPEGAAADAAWLAEPAAAALKDDHSATVEGPNGARRFVGVLSPPMRLLVVGAVHIAQSLARLAAETGFAVTVIDPRGAWATEARFPGVAVDRRWPAEALAALQPDRRTAVVSLSHDPKLDDPALTAALATDAFYVGALGSRRTHEKRLKRLADAGVGRDALKRIHGPVGLSIGALTPAEIAVSILGQIVAERRAKKR